MKKIPDHEVLNSKFGRLTPLFRVENVCGKRRWRCICDCGNYSEVDLALLRSGRTQSCGCIKREQSALKKFGLKHGQSQSAREYVSWKAMNSRCNNENHHAYANYGGRGIKVCERWSGKNGYVNFKADMGDRPEGFSLDRIDSNLGYSPENCRWATAKQQINNRRKSIIIEHDGKTMCMKDWAALSGLDYPTFGYRYRSGWSMEKILSTPARSY